MNNELIATNQAALALPDLFHDFNFADLNKSIETLANSSKVLTDKEKELAVGVVSKWEDDVIRRLNEHESELDDFIEYLDPASSRNYYHRDFELDQDQQIALAGKTGTMKELQAYLDAKQNVDDVKREKPLETELVDDTTLPYEDRVMAMADNDKAWALYNLKERRLERARDLALYNWKKALQANEDIKNMIAYARQYRRNVKKFTKEASDKAQAAKLNISIADETARQALRELIDFAAKF